MGNKNEEYSRNMLIMHSRGTRWTQPIGTVATVSGASSLGSQTSLPSTMVPEDAEDESRLRGGPLFLDKSRTTRFTTAMVL